jgi:hypothetical protein
MLRRREPNDAEKKLATEAYDQAQEDAKIKAKRARQDAGESDLDDVQEGFPEKEVKAKLDEEREAREDRKKTREAEDAKRLKDRESRHETLIELRDVLKRRAELEEADEKADR